MSDISKLPPELIDGGIFSRLPVKSLLRFRCVSKHYCSLIDSPKFIKSQLLKYNLNPKSIITWNTLEISSVELDSLDNPILLHHPFEIYHKPNPSDTPFAERANLLGSCNGLICLLRADLVNDPSCAKIVFWNPSTRKYYKLPSCEIDLAVHLSNIIEYEVYGFGYDDVNDDYKLLRITQFYNEVRNKVRIYSLKSDSWRRLDYCPFRFATADLAAGPRGVFIEGSLHYLVNKKLSCGIARIYAFHVGTEEYHVVPHPPFSDMSFLGTMDKLGGKLCLICSYDKSHMDVWVMDNYGVKESWTKLFSVAQYVDARNFECPTPITFSKDGKQVLLQQIIGGNLLWYDLRLKKVKFTCLPDVLMFCKAFVFEESLVKLPHAANVYSKQGWRKNKRDDFLSKGFKLVL
ncbi:F-box protein CPR1-like [Apium graveolens]|uniref:F-box protein CPR1-like n=1 Tax=Apium graveolens TaxID=4045 RepID=UPI003D7BD578